MISILRKQMAVLLVGTQKKMCGSGKYPLDGASRSETKLATRAGFFLLQ